jgi:hypothetical protein
LLKAGSQSDSIAPGNTLLCNAPATKHHATLEYSIRSLSVAQWVDEIEIRFFHAIKEQIDSLPFRAPIKETVAKCGVEPDDFSPPCVVDWDIYTVSIRGEMTSITFTGWFFATTRPWHQTEDDEITPEPVWVDIDESKSIMIAFDGILRIDNAGAVSSEVVAVYTDLDLMPILDTRDDPDCIFGFTNFG